MLKTNKWIRQDHLESSDCPRVWRHSEKEKELKVEKFAEDNTWDAKLDGRIIENYDTAEEAIDRGEEYLSS